METLGGLAEKDIFGEVVAVAPGAGIESRADEGVTIGQCT